MKKNNVTYCKESAMFLPFRKTVAIALFTGAISLAGAEDVASLKKNDAAEKKKADIVRVDRDRMIAETAISEDERVKNIDFLYKAAAAEYEKGNFTKSIELLLKANDLIRGQEGDKLSAVLQDKLDKVRSLLGKSYYYIALDLFHKAEKSANDGKYDEAIRYSEEAIANYPPSKEIMEQMKSKYEKLKADSLRLKAATQYTKDIIDVTDNADEEKRDLTVARELRIGQNFYKTGQWAKARDHFNAVLRQDPYNEAAIDYLRRCYEKLLDAGRRRRNVMALERAAEVAWTSVSPVLTSVDDGFAHQAQFKPQEKINATKNIEDKLKRIIIPSLDIDSLPLSDVIAELRRLSQVHDVDKNGVNILLLMSSNVPAAGANAQTQNDGGAGDAAAPAGDAAAPAGDAPAANDAAAGADDAAAEDTGSNAPANKYVIERLKVENQDLYTILQHIRQLAQVKLYIEPHAVIFADPQVPFEDYDLRVFIVETQALDNMIQSAGKGGGAATDGGGGGGGGAGDGKGAGNINSADAQARNDAVKRYFEHNVGIPFPQGTALRVENGVSRIIVKNTLENLAMIEKKINQLNMSESTQCLTQVKFVEIAMNDLEELGFEYVLARTNDGKHTIAYEPINTNYQTVVDPATGNTSKENVPYVADESFTLVYKPTYKENSTTVLHGVEVTEKLPQSSAAQTQVIEKGSQYTIPQDGVYYKAPLNLTSIYGSSVTFGANSSLVRNAQTSTSVFSPSGIVTNDTVINWAHSNKKGYDMGAKMHALDQADSTDILSAPRITTISGQAAVIKMVTEKYYPDEWDEATLETVSGEGDGEDIPVFQPSIPTFGDATEEGIVLTVQPTVEDNYVITMPMTPIIQEFVGWTDYSYDIPLESGNETRYYPNTLKMPIIEARTINTTVISYDGETVVLGGVIRDRIAIVEDQYPILGDLPLMGRLFQSKGRGSEKVSLLIFLNNRLIKPDGSPIRENQERGIPSFRY
ncbi:MAG: hypothetical protein IKB16_02300 [Lentisphaeria bacterium]|nr:hypothetical protein [Lentisphaeria bacterium]